MGIFNVTDKFAADQFRISLNFSDEGWHNVSVVAKNFFFTDNETLLDEVFTYHLTFEIVGKVFKLISIIVAKLLNVRAGESDPN